VDDVLEARAVRGGVTPARGVPAVEMRQLHARTAACAVSRREFVPVIEW